MSRRIPVIRPELAETTARPLRCSHNIAPAGCGRFNQSGEGRTPLDRLLVVTPLMPTGGPKILQTVSPPEDARAFFVTSTTHPSLPLRRKNVKRRGFFTPLPPLSPVLPLIVALFFDNHLVLQPDRLCFLPNPFSRCSLRLPKRPVSLGPMTPLRGVLKAFSLNRKFSAVKPFSRFMPPGAFPESDKQR